MGRLTEYEVIAGHVHAIPNTTNMDSVVAKLAHYEDLEEAGRLIELPCAVGDTVWCTDREDDGKGAVTYTIHSEPFACLVKDLWGIKFFATKEEAEAKLKESEGGRNASTQV